MTIHLFKKGFGKTVLLCLKGLIVPWDSHSLTVFSLSKDGLTVSKGLKRPCAYQYRVHQIRCEIK